MSVNHLDPNPVGAPCVMVIFGASGDLTKRKLIPALCNLASDGLLSKQFAIVGFAANDYTTETFRKMLTDEIPKYSASPIDQKLWNWFTERIYYVKADFNDPHAYQMLREQIEEADKRHGTLGNKFCQTPGRSGTHQGRRRPLGPRDRGKTLRPRP
jgi:glucose-6-phosphate 1-dehydrogenase